MTAVAETRACELWFNKPIELLRVLSNALLIIGKDENLPMINAAKFEYVGGVLTVFATDRCQAFMETVPLSSGEFVSADFEFILPRETLVLWQALLRARRYSAVTLSFTKDEKPLVRLGDEITTIECVPLESSFPRIRELFPLPGSLKSVSEMTFTYRYLANLDRIKTARPRKTVTIQMFGPNKPTLVEFFEGPRILIMPARRSVPAVT